MSDPTDPRPATDPAAPTADNTVSRSDEPSEPSEPYLTGPEEPRFAAPAHPGEVGTFGRYRVLKKLGQGGMGAVYLGYDASLERKIALKVMLPRFAASAEAKGRFLREARSAAKVKSDHVVTIYEVNEERGAPFIAMEYLLGTPLDQFLKTKGNLGLPQALRVVWETALGLSAAHELGLIHRDIKPANLWLEAPKGRVKLLDFGLARPANDDAHLTDSGAVMGTPAYMSPEQGRGHKVDHRTDLFSLGVLLYRLTTGKMPFTGDSTMAVLTSLAIDTPIAPRQHNPQIPESLEGVIDKLLAKAPAERFQTAREVLGALAAVENPRSGSGPLPVVVATPVQPLVVGAQTQNVWEGIEDSGSQAVPLDAPADTAAEAAPAERRAKPERKPSKLPAILACGLLLVACAVLAIVLWPKKQEPSAPEVVGGNPPPPSGKQPPPQPAPGPDRKAAEHVLRLGGYVRVNGGEKWFTTKAELPPGRFELTGAGFERRKEKLTVEELAPLKECRNLSVLSLLDTPVDEAGLVAFKDHTSLTGLNLNNTGIGNDGLANFKGCKNLTTLAIRNAVVIDDGLSHFKDCKNLSHLDLGGTLVTDAGLLHFKDCKKLTHLTLRYTKARDTGFAAFKDCKDLTNLDLGASEVTNDGLAWFKDCNKLAEVHLFGAREVTDAGLLHLKGLKQLTYLNLQKTKVTVPGITEFAKAQPQCKIVWDGPTIEPTSVLDPDRAAAEWVLSVGGRVYVNGEPKYLGAAAELPKERFTLTGVFLGNIKVPDASLAIFKDFNSLTYLSLQGTSVSDAGLAHFKNCRQLVYINLGSTAVTDAGLAHLKDNPQLCLLYLSRTQVSDAGLAPFRQCKPLAGLDVRQTKVTAAAIAEFTKALPKCRIQHDGGTLGPADPDRAAAEAALALGGTVSVNGKPDVVKVAAELPKEPFALTAADFKDKNVTDADLAPFKDCKNLTGLNLNHTAVTDAGLAHLKDCKNLTGLDLTKTRVGDAGLAHLKDRKNMTLLQLYGTQVTDAGLAHVQGWKSLAHLGLFGTKIGDAGLARLKDCKDLQYLDVRQTKVTATAIAEFAQAMPQCRIAHDGGTIEPKK